MNIINGNLFVHLFNNDVQYDVLVHGCNCFHIFGRGFARELKFRFPCAYEADRNTEYGTFIKLGTYSRADTTYMDINNVERDLTIINAYTQFGYGHFRYHLLADTRNPFQGSRVQLHYDKLYEVLQSLSQDFPVERFIIPAIGCGLAGGHWPTVRSFIEEILGDRATVVLNGQNTEK